MQDLMADFALVVVAGGSGTRMGVSVKKAFLELAGEALLVHTCRAFRDIAGITEIVVVLPGPELEALTGGDAHHVALSGLPPGAPEPVPALRECGVTSLVRGGKRRQDSVLNGLKMCAAEYVMIHDGARPFVSPDEVAQLMRAVPEIGAAILAHPVRDTLKQVEHGEITGTVDRSALWSAQTPQAFRRADLLRAFERHNDSDVTDDAAMAALDGITCAVVHGSALNFKVTTPEDLLLAEALLKMRREA
jgi:2-C-methyl-D-erythritol 4-phosphate cytidylyltransferase